MKGNQLKQCHSYLHHGDSGVDLRRQRNVDLILVSVNTGGAEETLSAAESFTW